MREGGLLCVFREVLLAKRKFKAPLAHEGGRVTIQKKRGSAGVLVYPYATRAPFFRLILPMKGTFRKPVAVSPSKVMV